MWEVRAFVYLASSEGWILPMEAHWNNLGSLKDTDAWSEVQSFWFIGLEPGLETGNFKNSSGEPSFQLTFRTTDLGALSTIVFEIYTWFVEKMK